MVSWMPTKIEAIQEPRESNKQYQLGKRKPCHPFSPIPSSNPKELDIIATRSMTV